MQKAAMTSRFLTGCSSKVALADSEIAVSRRGLLQNTVASCLAQTAHSHETFVKLTNRLIRYAEQALVMRDMKVLDEVSGMLMNLPVDTASQIGRYYYSLAIYRTGRRDEADALLERIADDGPITYKTQALQALGAHHHVNGRLDEALRFQLEALKAASHRNDLQTTLMALWEISILKSLDGDHKGALSDLKSLSPLVHLAAKQKPFYFYAFHVDLAVDLGELGHIGEAQTTLDIALASPYAPLYPNWAETRLELDAKRTSATPSVVAVCRPSEAIPASRTQPQPCQKPNRVVAFWWFGIKGNALQSALAPFAGLRARARKARREILEVLGRSIRSRAPPVRTE